MGCTAASGSPTDACSPAPCPHTATACCSSASCTQTAKAWWSSPPARDTTGHSRSTPAPAPTTSSPAGARTRRLAQAAAALAALRADRGEEVFLAPRGRDARGDKRAVAHTRALWVDVDAPGQLHHLWAFLTERPCHLLLETAGSGGVHCYWLLDQPLPATRTTAGTEVEPIERANQRLIHRLGVGQDDKPNVADPACKDRSRVMRLAGSVNTKTGQYARILEADFQLAPYPIAALVGDLPTRRRRIERRGPRGGSSIAIRTSGSARQSTSRRSPGSRSPAAGSSAARLPGTTTCTRPARSAPTPRRAGNAMQGPVAPGARSMTSRPCCSAARGAATCAATSSNAPAPTSPTSSATSPNHWRGNG